MNELNLRVAALKLCARPKESARLREKKISLPSRWQRSQATWVQKFSSAESSADQVGAVKSIFHESQNEGDNTVSEFLSDVLFECPLKHAVRNQLTKLFSDKAISNGTAAGHTKESLLQALIKSLSGIAETIVENPNQTSSWLNDHFVSVNACFQNFPYGREALRNVINLFVPLLPRTLERYWEVISDSDRVLSPTRRNQFYLFIHNILRFHVAIMSDRNIQPLISDREPLSQLNAMAYTVGRNMDTPWDVRSTAGLLIAHTARFLNEFERHLVYCGEELATNNLPIQAGVLLVLQEKDYETVAMKILAILDRILMVAKKDGNITNMLVFLSKHLFIYSKSLKNIRDLPNCDDGNYRLILHALLMFAIDNISSSTDSIRHMCSSLLRQVLQLAKPLGLDVSFDNIFIYFEYHQMSLKNRCLMLEQLVGVMDVAWVVEHCPSLFDSVFPDYIGRDDSVDALYKAMMTSGHKSQIVTQWREMWCGLLIEVAQEADERLPAIERLIMQYVKLQPGDLYSLLLQEVPMSTKLTAMLTIRPMEERRELLELFLRQLNEALIGLDDHTRLLALRFMLDNARPSECFSQDELVAIMFYVKHNANNPSAHIRQLGYGLLEKSLKRMELSLAQHKKRPNSDGEGVLKFLRAFMNRLSLNLFPTANYGRRWISLRLLRRSVDMCYRLGIPFKDKIPTVAVKNLEYCLSDGYEHNKEHAVHLLCLINKTSRLQPDNIMDLLLSLRPPDSVTGAYQLQVYCYSEAVEAELPESTDTPGYELRVYKALMWCYGYLREGTALAQQDLAEAAKVNPLYGLLFATRHLIKQLDAEKLAQEEQWRRYIKNLVELCLKISQVVLPIVSSSSPEGFLPANQRERNQNVLRRRLTSRALEQLRTTPQMVLLCGWRCVKEIALILGELVQRAPLEEENPNSFLLSKSHLATISNHFLLLLAETKHRGAFEQAYVGFTMLCRRFWLSDKVSLNQLPNRWVEEAIQKIQGGNTNLCSTRRSAGLPLMLQAIICTELQLGTHRTLNRTISLLLEICESQATTPEIIVSRSHALNILRALYRCSELADLVGEYVSRGVICALNSLLANEWSERNSATLLLAALIVRIFGVERARSLKGDLHLRNRMTGREFFTHYPELFDYFYTQLKQAALKVDARENVRTWTIGQTVQLEAMLLILSRLHPSSEGTESSLNLIEFVPFLTSITSSHGLITRERAAQVLANFVSSHRIVDIISNILVSLNILHQRLLRDDCAQLKLDQNHLHGQVLQLGYLYQVVKWTNPPLARLMIDTLSKLAVDIHHRDIFIFITIVDVLVAIMEDVNDSKLQLNEQLLRVAYSVYRLDHDLIYKRCEEYATSPRPFQLLILHLHRLILNKDKVLNYITDILMMRNDLPLDVEDLNVEVWLYVIFQSIKNSGPIDDCDIEYYHFNADFIRYYEALETPLRTELATRILASEDIYKNILRMLDGRYCSPKLSCRLYALLALLPKQTFTLDQILRLCSADSTSELQPGLILGLIRGISECGLVQNLWMPVLLYALQIAEPKQKNYMRQKACHLCEELTKRISEQLRIGDVEIMGHYCRFVIILLLDESEYVRYFTVEMLSKNNVNEESEDTPTRLPSLAVCNFLKSILTKLQTHSYSVDTLLRFYNIIVEPFIESAQRQQSRDPTLPEEQMEVGEDFELFERQEMNLYREELYLINDVNECFKAVYPDNEELINALHTPGRDVSFDSDGTPI